MGNTIIGKLTATDVGVIVFAVMYLFERFALLVQKIRGVKETSAAPIKCPADIREAVKEIYTHTEALTKVLTATDEDGAPKFFVKQHLYRSIGFIKGELAELKTSVNNLKALLHRIENNTIRD